MNPSSKSSGADLPATPHPRRVFVVGATGYIGRHVARELVRRGHAVVCFARERSGVDGAATPAQTRRLLAGAEVRFGNVCDAESLMRDGIRGARFDAVVSCLASRTGGIADSWRVDYRATRHALDAGKAAGAGQFVLLSALCVQKPRLAFQQAKLAFERELMTSGLTYSIVRPTAFFKSLAGQVEAVKAGKPFVLFGDGETGACKPISEADVARFVADCLEDPGKQDRILPVGGPGPALSPRARGEMLFELAGREPRFRRIPIRILDAIIPALAALARVFPRLEDKAEFARIARYYATESMLVLNPETGEYDAALTPSYGRDTLRDFYANALAHGLAGQERGDHALF